MMADEEERGGEKAVFENGGSGHSSLLKKLEEQNRCVCVKDSTNDMVDFRRVLTSHTLLAMLCKYVNTL